MAGLDAGHAYNEFPLMGGSLVPAEYWAQPGLRNFFENTAAVQFNHRLLATTTLASVATVWIRSRATPLPRGGKLLLHGLMAVTACQVGYCFHAIAAQRGCILFVPSHDASYVTGHAQDVDCISLQHLLRVLLDLMTIVPGRQSKYVWPLRFRV